MLHKFTALILACLMLVVTTTSQAGLSYCLCDQTIFLGDCPCTNTSTKSSSDPQTNQCTTCHGCKKKAPPQNTADISPCDNCHFSLDWKLDQYLPQPSADFKTTPDSLLKSALHTSTTVKPLLPNTSLQAIEIRGSPPPFASTPTVPLYIRHSSFLI